MSGYVVTVEFRVKPDEISDFLRLVTQNARLSAETEPACRQFDVVVPDGAPHTVFLYEIYDDKPGFEKHMATPHFHDFDRQSAPMVRSKSVSAGRLHFAGRSPTKSKRKNPKDIP